VRVGCSRRVDYGLVAATVRREEDRHLAVRGSGYERSEDNRSEQKAASHGLPPFGGEVQGPHAPHPRRVPAGKCKRKARGAPEGSRPRETERSVGPS